MVCAKKRLRRFSFQIRRRSRVSGTDMPSVLHADPQSLPQNWRRYEEDMNTCHTCIQIQIFHAILKALITERTTFFFFLCCVNWTVDSLNNLPTGTCPCEETVFLSHLMWRIKRITCQTFHTFARHLRCAKKKKKKKTVRPTSVGSVHNGWQVHRQHLVKPVKSTLWTLKGQRKQHRPLDMQVRMVT